MATGRTGREGSVRHFARCYIIEQLQVNGYDSQAEELRRCRNSDNCCDDEDAEEILHKIAEQLTKERGKHFEQLCTNLELNDNNVLDMYDRIVTELFAKDVHWGGVVTLVSFTGVMVVHLARHGLERQIPGTLEHMDSVIHHKVLPWIILKGGWVGNCCVFSFHVPLSIQSTLWRYFDETITKPSALIYGLGALITIGIGGFCGLKKIGVL